MRLCVQLKIGNKEECRLAILTNKGNEKLEAKNLCLYTVALKFGS